MLFQVSLWKRYLFVNPTMTKHNEVPFKESPERNGKKKEIPKHPNKTKG